MKKAELRDDFTLCGSIPGSNIQFSSSNRKIIVHRMDKAHVKYSGILFKLKFSLGINFSYF